MKKLLAIALMLMATSAFAQTDTDVNGIGLYFDQNATINCNMTQAPGTFPALYLIATNLNTNGISGWECALRISPEPMMTTVTLNFSALNVLAYPLFNVGIPAIGGAGVGDPTIVLATVMVFYGGGAMNFGIGPCIPASLDGTGPVFAAGDNPGNLQFLHQSSNVPWVGWDYTYCVATINGTLCPVGNEEGSWGSVKALYQ